MKQHKPESILVPQYIGVPYNSTETLRGSKKIRHGVVGDGLATSFGVQGALHLRAAWFKVSENDHPNIYIRDRYYIMWHDIILYYITWYDTILYYIVLYYIMCLYIYNNISYTYIILVIYKTIYIYTYYHVWTCCSIYNIYIY